MSELQQIECDAATATSFLFWRMIDDSDYAKDLFFEGGLSRKGQPLSRPRK